MPQHRLDAVVDGPRMRMTPRRKISPHHTSPQRAAPKIGLEQRPVLRTAPEVDEEPVVDDEEAPAVEEAWVFSCLLFGSRNTACCWSDYEEPALGQSYRRYAHLRTGLSRRNRLSRQTTHVTASIRSPNAACLSSNPPSS